jgi:hypothetical protein
LLAISRCFAGSIAAKPRFEPPLFVVAIIFLLLGSRATRLFGAQLPMLIDVRELPFRRT